MEQILVAAVTSAGLLAVSLLGVRLNAQVKNVQKQVQNGHGKPMRDEQDERHGEVMTILTDLRTEQVEQRKDIGGIRSELRDIRTEQRVQAGRIHDLGQKGKK